jgi:hypothetical protein
MISGAVSLSHRAPPRRVVTAASADASVPHLCLGYTTVANVCKRPHVLHAVLSERATLGFENPHLAIAIKMR